jgi:type II secretory pathway component PulF
LPKLIGGLLLTILAVPIGLRILGGRWLYHRFISALPLFGRLWTWSGQYEFAAMLAGFLDLRLPLARAVDCTGQLLSDRNVARSCCRLVERLEEGQALGASMAQSISFDPVLTSMAAWGESDGLLADALLIASDLFEDRIEQHLSLVRRLIPPLTLIGIGAMAIFVSIGLFIPLIRLIEGLSS